MFYKPPAKFQYSDSTKNLFLYFQVIMEMTFNYSPDTYKVKIHNTHTLLLEAYSVYMALHKTNSIGEYYIKYIPIIIDEALNSLSKDTIAKQILGKRYNTYQSILKSSKASQKVFEDNILNLLSYFNNFNYYNSLKKRIKEIILSDTNQKELLQLTNDWLSEMNLLGYSYYHINHTTYNYFNNTEISSPNVINEYLEKFNFVNNNWEILFFFDEKLSINYNKSLHEVFIHNSIEIKLVSDSQLEEHIQKNSKLKWVKDYSNNSNKMHEDRKLSVALAIVTSYDPYSAAIILRKFLNDLSGVVTIFDNERKANNNKVACLNYEYSTTINIVNSMKMRNKDFSSVSIEQIAEVIRRMHMSNSVQEKFLESCKLHNDAVLQNNNDKYVILMLWTALESLFLNTNDKNSKIDIVKYSLIEIIQRTYISKLLKNIYSDLIGNINIKNKNLIDKYNLNDIENFINVLFDDSNSECINEITKTLSDNPLLRLRLYILIDEKLENGSSITKMLTLHLKKIEWQIERIYRSRNLLVHSGFEVPFNSQLVENLHCYYDFTINYILGKSYLKKSVISIKGIIKEAKIDNAIHLHMLKDNKATKDNTIDNLFGPSNSVLKYNNYLKENE